ncbi:hypothetical protein [Shinella pollutisoli]|uniref:Uncharacterized protein n=1 Tax=Shinella pollutisoli TaxID=2250594 RepID=A0ABV7DKN5_9HYPH|nr:hypothetical protein [Shinella pollutisoli]
MNDNLLRALYETKRQSFLLGFIQAPDRFDSALAFAYQHRIEPIFHEQTAREIYGGDPFSSVYAIDAAFVDSVSKYIDANSDEKKSENLTFCKMEDEFGGRAVRMKLRYALEYIQLSERFEQSDFEAILRHAPAEAKKLVTEFTPQDVDFG